MTGLRTIIRRRRAMAVVVAVALGASLFPAAAFADVGVQGGSYLGASEPTGYKPQSKLWHHAGSWWGVLFNPTSKKFEIYKYNRDLWSWSSTGEVVDDRPTAKVDAVLSGTELFIVAAVPAVVADKSVYLHKFSYGGTDFARVGTKFQIINKALEEVVLDRDSTGVLWANWTDDGTVYVTHSNGSPHTSWVAPYPLATGLVASGHGDSSSIVAFGGKIGVMWSNESGTAQEGFHFAVHADGAGDDTLLNWTFENALIGANQSDDHMHLKALPDGELLAAVKHEEPPGPAPQISVLRRTTGGVWSQHVVWVNADNTTRPVIEVDTTANPMRAHVFAPGVYSGLVYRKDASLTDLAFPTGQGSQFVALSTDAALNNVTSTKQTVNSSVGLLVMAGDDVTHRYAFNYLTLGGAAIFPAPPTGVTGLAGNASIAVSWSPPGNDGGSAVTGYVVTPHVAGVALAPRIFNSTATTQAVIGLLAATAYTFTVRAQNSIGVGPASAPSAPVSTFGPPGAPTAVTATPGNSAASVTWLPPASNGGSALTGYTVTSSPGGMTATVGGTSTSAVVSGLTNGVSYTFTVKATNIIGTGPASAPSAPVAPLAVPGSPTGVTALPGNASATVSWNAPGDIGGSPISGYVVTWAVNGINQSSRTFLSAATTQTITGLTNGTTYTFRAAGINGAGTGLPSIPSGPVTPRTLPGAPTGVTAVANRAPALVSWNAPADNGGGSITGYVVTPSLDGVAQTPRTFGSAATSQTVAGLDTTGSYTFTVSAVNAAGTGPASAPSAPVSIRNLVGYWMLGADGLVYAFGDAQDHGEPGTQLGSTAAVDIESEPGGDGYWVVDESGRVFAYRAPHLGNVDVTKLRPNEKVTSLSATPAGDGYWIFTTAGRVLVFGNAESYGDLLAITLNGPVLDSIATPSGKGYYLVASDGGVFTFGDARFHGSMGNVRLNAPVQSLVPDPDGVGYWLVASDGGVFTFQAAFRGSMGSVPLNRPVTGMVAYGNGYLMVGEDGGIFNFSDLPFRGSLGSNPPSRPIVAVAGLS